MKCFTMVMAASLAPLCVWAAEVQEHPLIRPYPDSVLAENMCKHDDFGQFKFRMVNEETGKTEEKNIKGEYWKLLYEVRKADGSRVQDISALEFMENYKQAAEEKGGKVLHEDQIRLTFSVPRDDGGITYCQLMVTANLGQQYLAIVDEEPFKKSLTFGPAEMKAALDADGRVRLYGILFDLDKATLKQESDKQLQHVVTLLLQNEDLTLEVQGHTDSQGSDEYNKELSQRRAETVVAYLGLFGIEGERLSPRGYGESEPVASNDTEEGRAQNRRVELVKKDGAAGGK